MTGPISQGADGAPISRQCTGHITRGPDAGRRCRRSASHGTNVCTSHGASAPQVKAAAQRRMDEGLAQRACEELGVPVVTTPAAALQDALAHAMGRVIYLRAKEGALGDELVWGTSKKVARTGAGQAGQPTMEVHQEAGLHVYSRLLMDAEDRLAAIAAAMLRAGIEQRRARVDEQLVDQFRRVTDGMLARLELTPEQMALVPEAVASSVRALAVVPSA